MKMHYGKNRDYTKQYEKWYQKIMYLQATLSAKNKRGH